MCLFVIKFDIILSKKGCKMTEELRDQYKIIVKFLAEALGSNYEVILHDINKPGANIAAISNSHISGRSTNSPITGFALELMQSKKYLETDYITNYKAKSKLNQNITGSTLFIKNGENLVGMLCINHDTSKFETLSNEILKLGNLDPKESKVIIEEAVEQLNESLEEIIENILNISPQDTHKLKPKQRIACIIKLYEKGIFNVKNSIPKVAKYMEISESSIYRYLQNIQKNS